MSAVAFVCLTTAIGIPPTSYYHANDDGDMMRTRQTAFGVFGRIVLGAAIGAAALLARHATHPQPGTDFDPDFVVPRDVLPGFYDTERGPDGVTYAWTDRTAEWRLADLRRAASWTVELRLRAPGRSAASPLPVLVLVDGVRVRTFGAHDDYQALSIDLPPYRRPGAVVGLEVPGAASPESSDRRILGVMVDSLALRPGNDQSPLPILSWRLIATSMLIGATFAAVGTVAGLSVTRMLLLVAFVCGAWSWLALLGLAPFGGFSQLARRGLAIVALAAGLYAALSRTTIRTGSSGAGIVVAITASFGFLKLLCLFHPELMRGDTVFHLNRLKTVMRGNYFFTSVAPGGEFPYPVSLYVVAGWFSGLTGDWIGIMRAIVLAAELCAGILVYVAVLRWWKAPATGATAVLLYHVVPAGFQIQAVAYLTNAFAQSLASLGLLLLAVIPRGRLALPLAGLAGLILFAALAGHIGAFLLLSVTLLSLPAIAYWRGDAAARTVMGRAAIVGAVAIVLSIGLYYRHFTPLYSARLQELGVPATEGPVRIPIQRGEAHQTAWVPGLAALRNRVGAVPGYLSKYLGGVLFVSAAIGFCALWSARPSDPLTILLIAWWSTCLLFFVVGLLTPIDVRYYLAAVPPLAIMAAQTVGTMWNRGGIRQGLAAAIVLWSVLAGLYYWLQWFGPSPPR